MSTTALIDRLQQFGFVLAGGWSLRPTVKSGVGFSVTVHSTDKVVYAFSHHERVTYVGVCREQTFRERMNAYQAQGGQAKGGGTNVYVCRRIKEALGEGGDVGIWAYLPTEDIGYRNLSLDLVAALERPLIAEFRPPWNREPVRTRGKEFNKALVAAKRADFGPLKALGLSEDGLRFVAAEFEIPLEGILD